MIERGVPDDGVVGDADRREWLELVPWIRAGDRCGCGTCPSIELVVDERPGTAGGPRIVLVAGVAGALLLLFVDGGRPSYLELAPVGDERITEFPPADEIR